jgi:hypothetical protein
LTVKVGDNYSPLWGNKLFQVVLNGKELKPIGFSLDYGSDGKGFIPPVSGTYEFEIPKDVETLGVLTFMTAGAKNYDVKVTNIEVVVKAEKSPITKKQFVQFNQVGYVKGYEKTAIVELPIDSKVKDIKFLVKDATGKVVLEGNSTYNKEFKDSGSKVMILDFSKIDISGNYTIVVPKQEGITEEIKSTIIIKPTLLEGYQEVRNATLMAFKWYTDGEYGPYKGVHEQDKSVQIYGTNKKIDVYGGWDDAGICSDSD